MAQTLSAIPASGGDEIIIFENHRKNSVSGISMNQADLDRCFSSQNLFGNDPYSFSDIDGNSMLQYVTINNSNTRNSNASSIVVMLEDNVRLQCGDWIYLPDFGLEDFAGTLECKPTSQVRYRIWSNEAETTNNEIRNTIAISDCDKYAFNLYSIEIALKNIAITQPVASDKVRLKQPSGIRDESFVLRNTAKAHSPVDKIYDTFVVTEYRKIPRKTIRKSKATDEVSHGNHTPPSTYEVLKPLLSPKYCVPVCSAAVYTPHTQSRKLDPGLYKWNFIVDYTTDGAGWQYSDDVKSSHWDRLYDPDRTQPPFHAVQKRNWVMIYCQQDRDVPKILMALASYYKMHPRGFIKSGDLFKEGHIGHRVLNTWKKRRFVLDNATLSYYQGVSEKGHIHLSGYELMMMVQHETSDRSLTASMSDILGLHENSKSESGPRPRVVSTPNNFGFELVFPSKQFVSLPVIRDPTVSIGVNPIKDPIPEPCASNANTLLLDAITVFEKHQWMDILGHQLWLLQLIDRYHDNIHSNIKCEGAGSSPDESVAQWSDPDANLVLINVTNSNYFNMLFHCKSVPPVQYSVPTCIQKGVSYIGDSGVAHDVEVGNMHGTKQSRRVYSQYKYAGPSKRIVMDEGTIQDGDVDPNNSKISCNSIQNSNNGLNTDVSSVLSDNKVMESASAAGANKSVVKLKSVAQIGGLVGSAYNMPEEQESNPHTNTDAKLVDIPQGTICNKFLTGDWKAKDRYVYIEYISTNNVNPVSPANYFLCYAKSESANDRAHAKKLSVAFISNLKFLHGKPIGNKHNNNVILASEHLHVYFVIDGQAVCLKLIFPHVETSLEFYRFIRSIMREQ